MAAATLFVDAEDFNRIRTSVTADGVEVVQTAGLDEAIEALALVILLDADGHANWPDALRYVVEKSPSTRVVLMARNADDRMWVEVLSQGAYDLLRKPLFLSEIRSAVLNALQIDNMPLLILEDRKTIWRVYCTLCTSAVDADIMIQPRGQSLDGCMRVTPGQKCPSCSGSLDTAWVMD